VHTTVLDDEGRESTRSELFALVTDLLDVQEYPALDLARAYPMRWDCETVIGRHKTDMGAGMPVLRSEHPEGVAQEMWALFAVYQALAQLIGAGVDAAGIPPERISFPHALAAATDTVGAFPPGELDLVLAVFFLKLIDPNSFVRERPDRSSPRKTKKARRLPSPKTRRTLRGKSHTSNRTSFARSSPFRLNARPLGPRRAGRSGRSPRRR
jgi:hypothetical protein